MIVMAVAGALGRRRWSLAIALGLTAGLSFLSKGILAPLVGPVV